MLTCKIFYLTILVFILTTFCVTAGDNVLKPRHIPQKPAKSLISDSFDKRHIEVKFRDGLDIGITTANQPFDRQDGVLKSSEASDIISKVMSNPFSY